MKRSLATLTFLALLAFAAVTAEAGNINHPIVCPPGMICPLPAEPSWYDSLLAFIGLAS